MDVNSRIEAKHHNIVAAARAGALEQIRDAGLCVRVSAARGRGHLRSTTTTTLEMNKKMDAMIWSSAQRPGVGLDGMIFVHIGQ